MGFCTWSQRAYAFLPCRMILIFIFKKTQIVKFFDYFYILAIEFKCMFRSWSFRKYDSFFLTFTWSFHVSQYSKHSLSAYWRLLGVSDNITVSAALKNINSFIKIHRSSSISLEKLSKPLILFSIRCFSMSII